MQGDDAKPQAKSSWRWWVALLVCQGVSVATSEAAAFATRLTLLGVAASSAAAAGAPGAEYDADGNEVAFSGDVDGAASSMGPVSVPQSALAVAALWSVVCTAAPLLALPFGGRAVDAPWGGPKRVMAVSDAIAACATACIAALLLSTPALYGDDDGDGDTELSLSTYLPLLALAAVVSACDAAQWPAFEAATARMLRHDPDKLERASGISESAEALCELAAPAVAGGLLALGGGGARGLALIFALDGVGLLIALAADAIVPVPDASPDDGDDGDEDDGGTGGTGKSALAGALGRDGGSHGSGLHSNLGSMSPRPRADSEVAVPWWRVGVRGGWGVLGKSRVAKGVVAATTVGSFADALTAELILPLVVTLAAGDATVVGGVTSAVAAGAVAGGAIVGALGCPHPRLWWGTAMLPGMQAALLIGCATLLSPSPLMLAGVGAAFYAASPIQKACNQAELAKRLPERLHGRGFAMRDVIAAAAEPVAAAVAVPLTLTMAAVLRAFKSSSIAPEAVTAAGAAAAEAAAEGAVPAEAFVAAFFVCGVGMSVAASCVWCVWLRGGDEKSKGE